MSKLVDSVTKVKKFLFPKPWVIPNETKNNIVPNAILSCCYKRIRPRRVAKWEKEGKPIPPPNWVKQTIVGEYREKSGYKILIETGTFYGDMIFAHLNHFKALYTIELSEYFYERAVKRFKKEKNVHLYFGDSSKLLAEISENISEPCIFWLDGHYSGGKTAKGDTECPIWAELAVVVKQKLPHIIFDDARLFVGENDYPTIDEIRDFFDKQAISVSFEVKDDIIRVIINP